MANHDVESVLSGDAALTGALEAVWAAAASLSGDASLVATDVDTEFAEANLSGAASFGCSIYAPPTDIPAVTPVGADSVSAGLATEYANNVPGPFRAETSWGTRRYYQALPGVIALLKGSGINRLQVIPWRLGAIKADLVAGTAGGEVAAIFDDFTGWRLAVVLDGTSRPYCVLQDVSGTIIAQSAPWGAAVPTGYHLSILLSWNADTGVVSFTVNGQAAPTPWTVPVAGPWTPLRPTLVDVGDGTWILQQVQIGRIPV